MPIRHILFFKIRSDAKPEHVQKWANDLMAMKEKVKGISELRVAPHKAPYSEGYLDRSNGYSWVLDGTYQDAAVLKEYTEHPDHRAAQAYGAEHVRSNEPVPVLALDYEY